MQIKASEVFGSLFILPGNGILSLITRSVFVDRREIGGTIQEQVDAVHQYVLGKINLGARFNGMYRQDVYELPPDSVRELIANAIVHRSYIEPGHIQVAIYDNRLEITSPGMLLRGVTIEKMKEGYSKIRNRALSSAFSYMKIIEQWGSGIPRIIKECQEYGLQDPELIDFDGDFRINLYRNTNSNIITTQATQATQATTQATQATTQATQATTQASTTNLSSDDIAVLRLIYDNSSITQKEMAASLGWEVNRVKYYINKLKKKNIIKRVGSSQKDHWNLLIEESAWQRYT